jgi:hypothetical protein
MKLYFEILWNSYKYHMFVCLLILGAYIWHESTGGIESEDHYTLWYAYGWISLLIPLLTVLPIIGMLYLTKERYNEIIEWKKKP